MNFVDTNQLESGLHFPCSSAALLSQESLHQPPLRKSSSAIDWNGAVVEATRKTSRQFDWQAALFDNSRKTSFSNLHPFTQAPQGGLVMTTLDNKQQQGMSVATAQMPQQQNFAQTLAQSSSTASAPAATTAPAATAPPPAPGSRGAHLFGGVFHRGFFSKPVERTEEENYRYLMALDR